jgi:hypothetical protein
MRDFGYICISVCGNLFKNKMKKTICITLFVCIASVLVGQSFTEEAFARRRALFAEELRTGIAIIPSTMRNGDLNKNFYYLTGVDKPGYIYVFDMMEGGKNGKLFSPEQEKELKSFIKEAKTAKKRLILSAFSSDFNRKYFHKVPFVNADSILIYKRVVKDKEKIAM